MLTGGDVYRMLVRERGWSAQKYQDGSVSNMASTIYKPKYRAKNGEMRESRVWWIKYYKHGRPMRETSESEKRAVAERLLRRKLGEIAAGISAPERARRLRYEDLRATPLFDYKSNNRKSLLKRKNGTEYICGLPDLDEFFAKSRVADIETSRIREFIDQRRIGAPNATINRYLALLRRMFNLAKEDGRLRFIPHFPMLKENNVRKGFSFTINTLWSEMRFLTILSRFWRWATLPGCARRRFSHCFGHRFICGTIRSC
jgi:hypothetical protein